MKNLTLIQENLKASLPEKGAAFVLNSLLDLLPPSSPKYNAVIALQAEYRVLQVEIMDNLLLEEAKGVKSSQLNNRVLLLIDDLCAEDFDAATRRSRITGNARVRKGSILALMLALIVGGSLTQLLTGQSAAALQDKVVNAADVRQRGEVVAPAPAAEDALSEIAANMVQVLGGTFIMGCLDGRDTECDDNQKPAHEVKVPTFYISKYEVTQAQWRAVMRSDPSQNKDCDQCPVENVSWNDAQAFLHKLNAQTGQNYRLPTEAEWEYAVRGGQPGKADKDLSDQKLSEWASHDGTIYERGNTPERQRTTQPVGSKKPNELGLYDMTGNVWEWVQDCWHPNYDKAPQNGDAWLEADGVDCSYHIFRGDSWYSTYVNSQMVVRHNFNSDLRFHEIGFRVAFVPQSRDSQKDSKRTSNLRRRAALREATDYRVAIAANTTASYDVYLSRWPKAANAADIRQRRDALASIAANMVRVPGGTFTMGCLDGRDTNCHNSEKPAQEVTISTFFISKYEVRQAQWRVVMGSGPSRNKGCDDCPVEQVSWGEVQDFLRQLNAETGHNYRLPTEAEWEYAARGGQPGKANNYLYSGSNDINEVAWYSSNARQGNTQGSEKTTRPVGGKKPNELGLYDMSGNVWEWCEDDWHSNYNGAPRDAKAWVDSPRGSSRVDRGGSWNSYPQYCRAAGRNISSPTFRNDVVGFRLARS